MRIVSLLSSGTEILCALGLKEQIVGRSHECDFPASIRELPLCTETKFNVQGTSPEIDDRIKDIVRRGLSVYRVFEDQLRILKPDVIVTQIQCEVCAVSEKDVHEALFGWMDYKPQIVSLNPNSLADIWTDIRKIAGATGIQGRGDALIAELQARMQKISAQTASLPKPRVASIEWIEPLMTAGNWVPELVQMAGGDNLFGIAGQHSPYMNFAELVQKNPDFLIVMPCGWDIERSRQDMYFFTNRPEWKDLKAVQTGKVFLTDGNQYFNRPGPRVVESLQILAEIFHPEVFTPALQGSGWARFEANDPPARMP